MKWLTLIAKCIASLAFVLLVNYPFAVAGSPQRVWLMQMFGIM